MCTLPSLESSYPFSYPQDVLGMLLADLDNTPMKNWYLTPRPSPWKGGPRYEATPCLSLILRLCLWWWRPGYIASLLPPGFHGMAGACVCSDYQAILRIREGLGTRLTQCHVFIEKCIVHASDHTKATRVHYSSSLQQLSPPSHLTYIVVPR